ncbi:hypothetical protein [Chitinophaga sp. LS1]|uniref:hypothetical protein n=1 Tax=Chitinophaga sp. LS1 TaxID=3051176 RepID=UPI002AAC41EA|nr:hypothetical protein [Chitinophaga sp. LS1]WPV67030.1 hypothetical protein QQL36_35145 [Chitinophaga sp. LS1]WPV67099.1 hypothetical protein QQL36_35505 [Chitinophaga sp. LS1]
MKHRNLQIGVDIKTAGVLVTSGISAADDLFTGCMVSGVEVARLLHRLCYGTGETVLSCKGKGTRTQSEAESTNGQYCGRLWHSSEEVPVMGMERRPQLIGQYCINNLKKGGLI